MQLRRKKAIDSLFDGHLEKDITTMPPKEKLLYLCRQIELRHFIKNHVKRVPRKKG